jgi:hypothetical protein
VRGSFEPDGLGAISERDVKRGIRETGKDWGKRKETMKTNGRRETCFMNDKFNRGNM